jgi:hypothetical protein
MIIQHFCLSGHWPKITLCSSALKRNDRWADAWEVCDYFCLPKCKLRQFWFIRDDFSTFLADAKMSQQFLFASLWLFVDTHIKYFNECYGKIQYFHFQSLFLDTTWASCVYVPSSVLRVGVSPRGFHIRILNTFLVCLICRMFQAHHILLHFLVLTGPD